MSLARSSKRKAEDYYAHHLRLEQQRDKPKQTIQEKEIASVLIDRLKRQKMLRVTKANLPEIVGMWRDIEFELMEEAALSRKEMERASK